MSVFSKNKSRSHIRAISGVAAFSAIAIGLSACGADPEQTSDSRAAGEPKQGGTIVYAHDQEPPCLWGGWVQQAYVSRQILDSLVSQVSEGEIVPWLATDWEVSEDHKVWTFKLKEGVEFTDGTPFNAEAVVRNFDWWLREDGNSTVEAYLGTYYDKSVAISEHEVELHLLEPYSPLLSALSQAYFGIQSPKAIERGPEQNCVEPIGTGPFKVEKWHRGSHIDFVRNDNYNSAPANALHQGPAYVDGIEWRFVNDQIARYGAITSGEAQVIYDIPSPQWQDANQRFEVQQYVTPGRPFAIGLNTQQGPFADVLVRQAFAYGTDRKSAVETAFNGVIPYEGNGSVSQSTPGYSQYAADAYAYDPEKAKELLNEAGWEADPEGGPRTKDGEILEVDIVYAPGSYITPEGQIVLESIQENANSIGFKANLIPVTRDVLVSGKYGTPDSYDARPTYWTSPSSAVLLINFRQHLPESPNTANLSFYNNPELEQIIRDANSTLELEEQNELYREAQDLISDEAASIGLYVLTTTLAINDELEDVWIEDSQGEPVFHDAYFAQ